MNSFTYGCRCGIREERPTTKEQKKEFRKSINEMLHPKPEDNVHLVWYKFCKKFMKDMKFKYKGYDLMRRIDKYIESNPEIIAVTCDDDSFCGSSLYSIPHDCKNQFMGTMIVYVPQCTGEEPTRFFLYPSHNNELIKLLLKRQAKAKKYKER